MSSIRKIRFLAVSSSINFDVQVGLRSSPLHSELVLGGGGKLELVRRCGSYSCEGHCVCAVQDKKCGTSQGCTVLKNGILSSDDKYMSLLEGWQTWTVFGNIVSYCVMYIPTCGISLPFLVWSRWIMLSSDKYLQVIIVAPVKYTCTNGIIPAVHWNCAFLEATALWMSL